MSNSTTKMTPPLGPAERAAEGMDWQQVVLNGGPPCFQICEDGHFCGRAQRWEGHKDDQFGKAIHTFVPFHELIAAIETTAEERGVKNVLLIRCLKHLSVPQQNSNEHSGGECGACITAEYASIEQEKQDAQQRIRELEAGELRQYLKVSAELEQENQRLREASSNLIKLMKSEHGFGYFTNSKWTQLIETVEQALATDKRRCEHKQSDMTPCVIEDGECARADDGCCVGCGRKIATDKRG